jgi:hypothetical protein
VLLRVLGLHLLSAACWPQQRRTLHQQHLQLRPAHVHSLLRMCLSLVLLALAALSAAGVPHQWWQQHDRRPWQQQQQQQHQQRW